jgi:hypothetical protein
VCEAFGRALSRPCHYVFDEHVEIKVPIPAGYKQQLSGIEVLFGKYNAPYFAGPEFDYMGQSSAKRQNSGESQKATRRSSETIRKDSKPKKLTSEARSLWEGWRGIEEYAREAFVVEEEANGKTWMTNKTVST